MQPLAIRVAALAHRDDAAGAADGGYAEQLLGGPPGIHRVAVWDT